MPAPAASKPPAKSRRWRQFTLRSLLWAVMLASIILAAWRVWIWPYYMQHQAAKSLIATGGEIQTAIGQPQWLGYLLDDAMFQDIVYVDLADSNQPEDYLRFLTPLPRLQALAVGGEAIGDKELQAMGSIKSLEYLILDSTNVTDSALHELRAARPSLKIRTSQRLAIRDATAKHRLAVEIERTGFDFPRTFFDESHFEDVVVLSTARTNPSDADLAPLRRFRRLSVLVLDSPNLHDEALDHLVDLTELQVLYLNSVGFTDQAVNRLSRMQSLNKITVRFTTITEGGMAELRSALPKCSVVR